MSVNTARAARAELKVAKRLRAALARPRAGTPRYVAAAQAAELAWARAAVAAAAG